METMKGWMVGKVLSMGYSMYGECGAISLVEARAMQRELMQRKCCCEGMVCG
jgi:hypothetical protein